MTHHAPTNHPDRKAEHPLRLGILVSHPIQYFTPVYRELAACDDVDLIVLFRTRVGVDSYHDSEFGQTVKWDIPLLNGYRHIFLSSKTKLSGFESSIFWQLYQHRPDVLLVHGYNYSTNLAAIAWAKLLRVKVLMRGDTRLSPHHEHTGLFKRLFKRTVFRLIDGFLSIGSLNRAYYITQGARKDQLFFAPFCVDNQFFSLEGIERDIARSELRNQLGIPINAVVILYASKIYARKRPKDLLDAFEVIRQKNPEVWLLYVGSGEDEPSLKESVAKRAIHRVVFAGFQNQTMLPHFFAASDIFVLPSAEEPWGLVVNEAMASGLPVVVTDEVGAVPDLVEGKDTGYVYSCGNIAELINALETLFENPVLREKMSKNAKSLIADWDVSVCAERIVDAAKQI